MLSPDWARAEDRRLPVSPPFDVAGVFAAHRDHRLDGVGRAPPAFFGDPRVMALVGPVSHVVGFTNRCLRAQLGTPCTVNLMSYDLARLCHNGLSNASRTPAPTF